MKINLLIVEDDTPIITSWKQNIALYNVEADSTYDISAEYIDNLHDASNLISEKRFDVIVIDIRLKNNESQANKDGNLVIADAISRTTSLIAVCTAEPSTVELPTEQSDLIDVFQKGVAGTNVVEQCLEWLDSKKNLLATVQQMRANFDKEMAKLFSRSVWPRWSYWFESGAPSVTEKALTRHMATHLHASFLADDELGAHPEEYFFIPPLQENLDTGDIIYQDGKLEIIVTPRCDMLRSKSETATYQLVTLLDKSETWADLKDKLAQKKETGTEKQISSALSAIKKFTNHNGETGGHFIQEFRVKIDGKEETFGPFYAQFHQLRSIERTEENKSNLLETRIASLSNEFVPSLVERLGAYFSRIGTPDYSHPE
ncbi:hypothetical protein GRS44_05245 [Vibrio alginolyticus]|nr:hypothetical protein [Vibrio alginolyticus]ELA7354035.1 hypothetical protein [Vibrio alginolyticus]